MLMKYKLFPIVTIRHFLSSANNWLPDLSSNHASKEWITANKIFTNVSLGFKQICFQHFSVLAKYSLEGQEPLLQLSPQCFNVSENQCIYCNYQSQANMPQARKLLKIYQNIATLQEIYYILTTLHWGIQRCWESMCSVQLSCLRHICLTLIVALNTLIFGNVEAPGGSLKQRLPFF